MNEDSWLDASYEDRFSDEIYFGRDVDYDERDFDDFEIDTDDENECEGHESLNGGDMGVTRYCDGSCVTSDRNGPVETTQVHNAFNGHRMRYRVKPNGDLSEHDVVCVDECRACLNGDQRPDW